jgi:glycosyltransferase involved in cell wall biosynthesis
MSQTDKHIVFVHISTSWGGAERVLQELVAQHRTAGFRVSVLVNDELKAYKKMLGGKHVHFIGPIQAHTFIQRQVKLLALRKNLQQTLYDIKPNLIHANLEKRLVLMQTIKLPCKVVYTLHGWEVENYLEAKSTEQRIIRHFLKRGLKQSKWTFVAISNWMKKVLPQQPRNRITVIPNGVDVNTYVPDAKQRNRFQQKHTVLFVGRFVEPKGIRELVSAAKALPAVQFRFVGEGPLKTLISGPNCKLVGFLQGAKLKKEYQTASLCVFPSKREAFGLVALEAMACGTPVLSTKFGFGEIVVHKKTGYLLESNQPPELAAAIEYAFRDTTALKKMGVNARKQALKHAWDKTAAQYQSLYLKLI